MSDITMMNEFFVKFNELNECNKKYIVAIQQALIYVQENEKVLKGEQNKKVLGEIVFISESHKRFYYEQLRRIRDQDANHKALVYCLGINRDTREHMERIYDVQTECIKTKCLQEGWQTSGSRKVVRMAFNLYCNDTPSVTDYTDVEEQMTECRQYGAEELFNCVYAPYFWQAVQIRYPSPPWEFGQGGIEKGGGNGTRKRICY